MKFNIFLVIILAFLLILAITTDWNIVPSIAVILASLTLFASVALRFVEVLKERGKNGK